MRHTWHCVAPRRIIKHVGRRHAYDWERTVEQTQNRVGVARLQQIRVQPQQNAAGIARRVQREQEP